MSRPMTVCRPVFRHAIHRGRFSSRVQGRLQSQSQSIPPSGPSRPPPQASQAVQHTPLPGEHPLLTRARLYPQDFQPARKPPTGTPKSFHPALAGAIAGAMTSLAACGAWYYYTGMSELTKTRREAHQVLAERRTKIGREMSGVLGGVTTTREGAAPDGDAEAEMEAKIKWLRAAARNYGQYSPGSVAWVDMAFDELDDVRSAGSKGRIEADEAVKRCYDALDRFGSSHLGKSSAREAWGVIGVCMKKVHGIADQERDKAKAEEGKQVQKHVEKRKGRWWMVMK